MARAALNWGVRDLASRAQVSTNTIARFERGDPLKGSTIERVQAAFEVAGIEFIPEGSGGVGVRLRKT